MAPAGDRTEYRDGLCAICLQETVMPVRGDSGCTHAFCYYCVATDRVKKDVSLEEYVCPLCANTVGCIVRC